MPRDKSDKPLTIEPNHPRDDKFELHVDYNEATRSKKRVWYRTTPLLEENSKDLQSHKIGYVFLNLRQLISAQSINLERHFIVLL